LEAATVSCSAGLARFKASEIFAYTGRSSLNLFIINGFVATFLPPYIQQIRWPDFTPLVSIALAIGIIAAHLVALQILNPALAWIDRAAVSIANMLVRLIAKEAEAAEPNPV
jgi:peptidoglycan/LPS O-acetylase OafA/YrhL